MGSILVTDSNGVEDVVEQTLLQMCALWKFDSIDISRQVRRIAKITMLINIFYTNKRERHPSNVIVSKVNRFDYRENMELGYSPVYKLNRFMAHGVCDELVPVKSTAIQSRGTTLAKMKSLSAF